MRSDIVDHYHSLMCPILKQNKWSYNKTPLDAVFLYGMNEMFRWFGRRGGPITPEALTGTISAYMEKTKVDVVKRSLYEIMFQKHLKNTVYNDIKTPILNYSISLNAKEKSCTYNVPIVTRFDNRFCLYFYGFGKLLKKEFLSRIEVQFAVLYFYLKTNESPILFYSYLDGDTIKEERVNYNIDYLNFVTQNIQKTISDSPRKSIPDLYVCSNCSKEKECQIKANWLKQL